MTIVSAKLGVKILTVNPLLRGGGVNNLTPEQNRQLFVGYPDLLARQSQKKMAVSTAILKNIWVASSDAT